MKRQVHAAAHHAMDEGIVYRPNQEYNSSNQTT